MVNMLMEVNMGMEALQEDPDETKIKLARWLVLLGNEFQQVEAQNKHTRRLHQGMKLTD